jgi:hypothetical protein
MSNAEIMKTLNAIRSLMIMASSLFIVQCTSEPITIAGADGVDGVDGTASCIACHSNSTRDPILSAYAISQHAIGDTYLRGTSGTCAACHASEGFIDFMVLGAANADGYLNPTPINCATCHDDHDTFDFETDGPDYALRSIEPVPLRLTDPNYVIDLGGTSNLCLNCHQPRASEPIDDGTGTFEITNTRFGPHHSPQGTMFEGIGGAQIAGSMSYPQIASSAHRTGANCVSCHMGETTDGSDGSHTNFPTENACVVCHTNGAPSEVAGLQADLDRLKALLAAVVSQDGTVIGIVVDDHSQPGIFTILEARAAWNYLMVIEDQSNGVHNPAYAKALIRNSIEALE